MAGGLGRHPGLEGQFHSAEHGLFVVLQDERQDLHHFPVAARALQEVLPEGLERLGQFGEGRPVAQRAGLSLDHGPGNGASLSAGLWGPRNPTSTVRAGR